MYMYMLYIMCKKDVPSRIMDMEFKSEAAEAAGGGGGGDAPAAAGCRLAAVIVGCRILI